MAFLRTAFRLIVTVVVCTLALIQVAVSTSWFVAAVLVSRGTSAADVHRADIARPLYHRANALYPANADWWYAEGGYAMATLGPGFGLPLYERALELAPHSAQALVAVAERRALRGDLAAAEAHLDHLAAVAPERPDGHVVRALVASLQERPEDAIRHIDRAQELHGPLQLDWQAMKASQQLAAGDYAGTVRTMSRVIDDRPLTPQYRLVRGKAYLERELYREAREDFAWAHATYTRRHAEGQAGAAALAQEAQLGVARSYAGMENFSAAFDAIESLYGAVAVEDMARIARKLAAAAPQDRHAWDEAWLALTTDILIDLDELDAARDVIGPNRETGENPALWTVAARARLATAAGNPEQAIEIIEASTRPARSDVHIRFALAEAEAALGRVATARLEFASVARDRDAPEHLARRAEARYAALAGQ